MMNHLSARSSRRVVINDECQHNTPITERSTMTAQNTVAEEHAERGAVG